MRILKELLYRIMPWWAFPQYWRRRKRYSAELLPSFRSSVQKARIWSVRYRREAEDVYHSFRGTGSLGTGINFHYQKWKGVLSNRPPPSRILEVGSWMGSSAVGFARLFPNAGIICVDTW